MVPSPPAATIQSNPSSLARAAWRRVSSGDLGMTTVTSARAANRRRRASADLAEPALGLKTTNTRMIGAPGPAWATPIRLRQK